MLLQGTGRAGYHMPLTSLTLSCPSPIGEEWIGARLYHEGEETSLEFEPCLTFLYITTTLEPLFLRRSVTSAAAPTCGQCCQNTRN